MGACPKHKISKTSQRRRNSHNRLTIKALAKCTQCFEMKLTHRVCPACGYYNKRTKVLDIQKSA